MSSGETYDVLEIDVPLFGMFMEVFLDDISKLESWMKMAIGGEMSELEESEKLADGLTIDSTNAGVDGYVIMVLKDFRKKMKEDRITAIGILAHECLHAARTVLDSRGVPFTSENDEVVAYLQEHLVESTLRELKKGRRHGKR